MSLEADQEEGISLRVMNTHEDLAAICIKGDHLFDWLPVCWPSQQQPSEKGSTL